jgi:cytochrome c oxidase subunit 2
VPPGGGHAAHGAGAHQPAGIGRETPLVLHVTGKQWWWHARYPDQQVVTANEIHIPAGVPIQLGVTAEDVIHSFWIPQVIGKVDMVPMRTNSLTFRVERPGLYLGLCSEFCGIQHAHMRLHLHVDAPTDFATWLANQQRVPPAPTDPLAQQGQRLFLANKCQDCHTVRGTEASGTLGPDLTHVASRRTLGAATHENTRANLAGWTANPQAMKPGNRMPDFALDEADLRAIVAYLESLE